MIDLDDAYDPLRKLAELAREKCQDQLKTKFKQYTPEAPVRSADVVNAAACLLGPSFSPRTSLPTRLHRSATSVPNEPNAPTMADVTKFLQCTTVNQEAVESVLQPVNYKTTSLPASLTEFLSGFDGLQQRAMCATMQSITKSPKTNTKYNI